MRMVLVLNHRLRLHSQISIPRSSDSDHRRKSLHDNVLLSMRFGLTRRDFSLKRSFASGSRKLQPISMATKRENLVETSTVEPDKEEADNKKKTKKEEDESLPPPPEKPEPGDCCGSGCVRCVWDVYYEELEDYNKKLSASISSETKSN